MKARTVLALVAIFNCSFTGAAATSNVNSSAIAAPSKTNSAPVAANIKTNSAPSKTNASTSVEIAKPPHLHRKSRSQKRPPKITMLKKWVVVLRRYWTTAKQVLVKSMPSKKKQVYSESRALTTSWPRTRVYRHGYPVKSVSVTLTAQHLWPAGNCLTPAEASLSLFS